MAAAWSWGSGRMVTLATLTPPLSPAERVRGSLGRGICGAQNHPRIFPSAGTAPEPPRAARPSRPRGPGRRRCREMAAGRPRGEAAVRGGSEPRRGCPAAGAQRSVPPPLAVARFGRACRVQLQPLREPPTQQGRCFGLLVRLNFIWAVEEAILLLWLLT